MSDVSDIATLVELNALKPLTFNANEGREFVAIPDGAGKYKLEQITSPNKAEVLMPKVVTQHVKMQTAGSLVDYINRFKNDDTVLFADMASNSIVSIIDYHEAPDEQTDKPETADPKAKLGNHRVTLALPFSLEWQTWTRVSGKLMSHVEFATFLEENSIDIKNPVGADLLELCRDLQVRTDVSFGSSVSMGDYTEVNYKKESDASKNGSMKLPKQITLSIPVYFGEMPVPVIAFMRRKVDDGALFLGIQLSRAENVRQEEFHRIVDSVKENVDHLSTVYGTPA